MIKSWPHMSAKIQGQIALINSESTLFQSEDQVWSRGPETWQSVEKLGNAAVGWLEKGIRQFAGKIGTPGNAKEVFIPCSFSPDSWIQKCCACRAGLLWYAGFGRLVSHFVLRVSTPSRR